MRISDWSSDVCSSDLPQRHVEHDVGLQRDQLVDVVGGGDAERIEAAQLTDVAAGLLGAPGVAAHQLQLRMGERGPHRVLGHVASGPLHHSDGHSLSPWICVRSEEHTSELQSLMRISYAVFCL